MATQTSQNWYPELSYRLNGLAFDVFRRLGYGYHEKYYHRAYEKELQEKNIPYEREKAVRIEYNGDIIGRYQLDFLVDGKIAIEWKVARDFYTKHKKQVLAYLRTTNLHLGLIFLCTPDGVRVKRIAN